MSPGKKWGDGEEYKEEEVEEEEEEGGGNRRAPDVLRVPNRARKEESGRKGKEKRKGGWLVRLVQRMLCERPCRGWML